MGKANGKGASGTFQLGDCIGKGAFGSVYSGLNLETGEVVAIKQIKLANIPKSDLALIMTEIDLLKELNHSNIVQYNGSVKTKDHLNIVMEYCENGSLLHICKKYGNMPENLVAVYTIQILEGLQYLHEQGVMHRDIKAANILTTKSGQVKLADFGIACKVETTEKVVVGSPYWMAPEVIDLLGASTASDIWSLGCTIIELLQGHPPYYQLAAMTALFRIVQDDHPPIPDGYSRFLNDFLIECFQKDSNLRVTAKKLLKHPWVINAKQKTNKNLTNPNNIGAEVAKANIDKSKNMMNNAAALLQNSSLINNDINNNNCNNNIKKEKRNSLHDTTLQENSSIVDTPIGIPQKYVDDDDDNSDWDSLFDEVDLKKIPEKISNNLKSQLTETKKETQKSKDDFDEDFGRELDKKVSAFVQNNNGTTNLSKALKTSSDNNKYSNKNVPITSSKNESKANDKLDLSKFKDNDTNLDFNEIEDIETISQDTPKLQTKSSIPNKYLSATDDDNDDDFDYGAFDGEGAADNLKNRIKNKYIINENEDFDDINFEEEDPFSDIVEESDNLGLLNRDQQAYISSIMTEFLKALSSTSFSDDQVAVCTTLLDILNANPTACKMLITLHCVIPLLEVLGNQGNMDIIPLLLCIINKCCQISHEFQENICLLGGIPNILKFTDSDYSLDLRKEAAIFVRDLCQSSNPITLQMFIACNGMPIFVKFLQSNYNQCKELQWISIDGINQILELKCSTPRNDFCRMFVKEKLFSHVYQSLYYINGDRSVEALNYAQKLTNLLWIFSTGDSYVKRAMVYDISSLTILMNEVSRFSPKMLLDTLKCIKNISSDSETLDGLCNAGVLRVLVDLMDCISHTSATDLENQIAHTIFNVCRISKERQTVAASLGIIPYLKYFVKSNGSVKQFALPILCEMAHASKTCREKLWKSNVLETYLSMLSDKYWQTVALDAIVVWLSQKEEGLPIEDELLKDENMALLINAVCSARLNIDILLASLHRMLIISETLCQYLAASPEFIESICKKLKDNRVLVRLSLLKILTAVVEGLPQGQRKLFGQEYKLKESLTKYSRADSGVLVRESARKVIELVI